MRERLRASFEHTVRDSGVPRNNAKDSAHSKYSLFWLNSKKPTERESKR